MTRPHRPETRARRRATDLLELYPPERHADLIAANAHYKNGRRDKAEKRERAKEQRRTLAYGRIFGRTQYASWLTITQLTALREINQLVNDPLASRAVLERECGFNGRVL